MNGKLSAALRLAVLPLAAALLAACGGDGGGGGDNGDNTLDVNRRGIVEDGARPVWTGGDNSRFLFAYKQGEGPQGIYVSDLQGSVTALHEGAHNHDYTPSPDGTMAAFSTPEPQGGTWTVPTDGSAAPSLVLAGGGHPAWVSGTELVAEIGSDSLHKVDLNTGSAFFLTGRARVPVAPGDGGGVAFYRAGPSGLLLYWLAVTDRSGIPAEIARNVGLDAVFSGSKQQIIVSLLDPESQSVILRYDLSGESQSELLLEGASWPSVSGDDAHLYANRIQPSQPRTLYYLDLVEGVQEIIGDASFAAAEASGKALLVESDWGIERITF